MAKTQQPTGLSIKRDGANFILSWVIGDDNYDAGQQLQYISRVNGKWKSWDDYAVTTTDTEKVITIDLSKWYPSMGNTLSGVEFCVRGKRTGYDWSDFTHKTLYLLTYPTITISNTLTDANKFNAYFDIETDDQSQIYREYEWQTILVTESEETNGSNLNWSSDQDGWNTGTGTATSGTVSITEDTSATQLGSHTRWVRVRAKTTAGNSPWSYTHHTYAMPHGANLISAEAIQTHLANFYTVTAKWNATQNPAYPIDRVRVDYSFAVPTYNMLPPANPSWSEAVTAIDTEGDDIAIFTTNRLLGEDECLFVRVATIHDDRETYSAVRLAKAGKLATPSDLSVSVSGRIATVSVNNNSEAGIYTGSTEYFERLFIAITYRGAFTHHTYANGNFTNGIVIGVMTPSESSKQITLPDVSNEFVYVIEAQAIIGTYKFGQMADGTAIYTILKNSMVSDKVSTTGAVPIPASDISVEILSGGTAQVSWTWAWDEADSAELSWSDNPNAWNSTKQPETYLVEGHKESFLIEGLTAGKRYYLRIRLKAGESYSPYSEQVAFDVRYAPSKPIAKISDPTITEQGRTIISWIYASGDGTGQAYAEVMRDGIIVAHTTSAKHISLYASDIGWTTGSYDLQVRVVSESGAVSVWSDPVTVKVVPPLEAVIYDDTLETITVTEDGHTRQVVALTEMPLVVTVRGGNDKDPVTLIVERAETYLLKRPTGDDQIGYEGEIVYQATQTGDDEFTIYTDDLLGDFDENARYRIVAIVKDSLGQTSTATKEFEVIWSDHATMPTGTVSIVGTTAVITPTSNDTFDIYRLTADGAEVIVADGEAGQVFTDPYPAINGGYRIVAKALNGTYLTNDGKFAWVDIPNGFEYDKTIIDFGTDKVELYYNVDISHNWEKDFTETKYLGGSIQGDWNAGVSRSGSVSAVTLNLSDQETITGLRRLASYTGLCHVRTLDGSSFPANIEVSESRSHDKYGLIAEFTLNITRVDPEGYDGILEA